MFRCLLLLLLLFHVVESKLDSLLRFVSKEWKTHGRFTDNMRALTNVANANTPTMLFVADSHVVVTAANVVSDDGEELRRKLVDLGMDNALSR
jgi:hypothetical protein